jgi:hypothetical protein
MVIVSIKYCRTKAEAQIVGIQLGNKLGIL